MKINVLGTEYEFDLTTDAEDIGLCGCDGYCDGYKKRIAIETRHIECPGNTKDVKCLSRKVTRHEIIHAFLFESGLSEFAQNEQFVDWIAWQFPKLLETFKQVDAL